MRKRVHNYIFYSILFHLFIYNESASVFDYIPSFANSWFVTSNERSENAELQAMQKVPYEVANVDEKFIEQAAKFTGVALSELDKCQHRVILKLQQDCHKLNDEEISKLAVKLLNCQSSIEGRPIYPCTESMLIRDCTSKMDTDTWNSYLLMSNRARAVCYSVRQAQFRGLTELTVNKLMGAAHDQLNIMTKIKDGQYHLEQATSEALQSVITSNTELRQQQTDLQQAQFHGQLVLEDNIRRLADEKQLILEGHEHLAKMTKDVKEKLEEATQQIDKQADERRNNHEEILSDLVQIQQQAEIIFMRIEQASRHMLEQSQTAAKQYDITLQQLAQVNATVYSLVDVMTTTRSVFEEKLNWVVESLGGTENAVERLYLFISHITYLILAMISCAFLQIPVTGRIALVILVPLNLLVALQGTSQAFNLIGITAILISFITVQMLIFMLANIIKKKKQTIQDKTSPVVNKAIHNKTEECTIYSDHDMSNGFKNKTLDETISNKKEYIYNSNNTSIIEQDEVDDDHIFESPTPPLSRYGLSRSRSNTPNLSLLGSEKRKCGAKTRQGKPCSLSAQIGREFCYRHQTGTSIIQ